MESLVQLSRDDFRKEVIKLIESSFYIKCNPKSNKEKFLIDKILKVYKKNFIKNENFIEDKFINFWIEDSFNENDLQIYKVLASKYKDNIESIKNDINYIIYKRHLGSILDNLKVFMEKIDYKKENIRVIIDKCQKKYFYL